jgi:hypothetical protein
MKKDDVSTLKRELTEKFQRLCRLSTGRVPRMTLPTSHFQVHYMLALHWSLFRYHPCNANTDSFPTRHASSFSVERVSEGLVFFFENTTISLATNAGADTPRGLPLQLALVGCVACCISPHCAAPSVSQRTPIGCLRGQITRLGQGMKPSGSGCS